MVSVLRRAGPAEPVAPAARWWPIAARMWEPGHWELVHLEPAQFAERNPAEVRPERNLKEQQLHKEKPHKVFHTCETRSRYPHPLVQFRIRCVVRHPPVAHFDDAAAVSRI